ncbi:gustatory and odorant receptor 63a [Halyomorpha halys]|uniref:gustatory and odorant receptor 63a n=1 Tax=Halyomorpha halys TaxID=286706 RepID=UPI0006D4FD47|nr:gustatory and odorant receptor 63a-like [Halyomorpha halys]KAE8573881.1 Gustatory receptor 13 [Halyomorpha halys]
MEPTVPVFFTKEVKKQQWPELQQADRQTPALRDRSGFTFYQVTRPFIFALRLFGGFPYTVRKDVIHVTLCSWWTFYSVVVMLSQNALHVMTTHQMYFNNANPFDAKLFDTINIIIVVYQACGPLTFWFEIPAIIKYYNKWHSYEKDLHLCNIALDGQLKKWALFLTLPLVPYVFVAAYYQSMIHGNLAHMPSFLFLHVHTAIHLSFWLVCGLFLNSTATRVIRRMKKVTEDRDPVEVAACRRIWLTLAELTADLGNALGPTLMETLLFVSTVLIINCYFMMFFFRNIDQAGSEEQRAAVTGRLFYIVMTFLCITILCEFGQRCTNAVGWNLLQELLRLNVSPQEKQLHREVNMFIQSVSLRFPDMVLCGFLTLNRRLLVSLVSGGVTYLIVLVQFRSSSDQSL